METSVDNISSCNASINQLNDQMADADYLDTLIAAVTSHKEDTQENDNLTDIQNDGEKTEDKNLEEENLIDNKMEPSSPQAHSEQSEERNDDDEEEEVKKEEPNTDGNKKKKRHKRKRVKKVENDDDESDSDIVESKQSKIEMEDIKDIKEQSDVSFTLKDENEIKNESPSSSEDNADSGSSNSSDSDSSSSNSSSNEDGDSSSSSGNDDDDDDDDEEDGENDDNDDDDDDGKDDNEEEETQKDTEKVKSKEKSSRKGRKKKKSDSNDEEKPKVSSRKRKLTLKRQRKKEKEKTKRRNIRSILRDDQLEAETLAAQNEEMERQRRLQELKKQMQQKVVIKPEEKDSQLKSLLQGDCSSAAFYLGTDQLGTEETNKQFTKDDVILLDSGDENKKKVLTDIIELSDDDDVVMIKSDEEPEEAEEEEEEEDMDNVGTHINDELNQPDEIGNVLINIGHPEGDPDVFLPPHIASVIKPHQIGGIRFLYDNVIESQSRFKSSSGFGCILAHSMGLGKTIQLIGFIDIFLRFTEAQSVLCIVPINTIQNWLAEFNMWLPEKSPEDSEDKTNSDVTTRNFKLFVINDNHKTTLARAKILDEWSRVGGVLLMGYEMYRLLVTKKCTFGPPPSRRKKKNNEPIIIDIEEEDMNKKLHLGIQKALVNPGPDLIVCDEGHRIKNSLSGVAQSLKNIKTKRRIVLTGYPLQNNLLEYWCMVDFVRPNYLGTKAEFCNMFERPIMNGQCVDSTREDVTLMRYRAHVLHSLLQGFIQRRGHSVLQYSLPPKQEHVFTIRMSNIQRQLYKKFMDCISDCEMGMWASYNPLKAFSTCCKIWNHPDVMWKIIQHQKTLLEDNDLDFEPDGKVNGVQSGGKKKNKTIGNSTRMNANAKKKILPEPINIKNNAHKCCSNNRSNTSDNLNLGFQPKGMGMNSCSGSRDSSCCNYNLGQDLRLCCNSGMQSCNSPGMNNTPSGNNTCNDNSLEQNMNFMSSKMSNMKDNNNQLSASYLNSTCHKDSNSGINTINQGCHINKPRGDMVRNLEPGECLTRNESSQNNCINNDRMIPGSHIAMNASCDQTNTRHLMDSGSMNSENHIGSLGYLNTHSNSDAHGCLNTSRHNDVNNIMNANDQMNLNYGLNSGSHLSGNSSMNMVSRDVINSNCAIGDSSNLNSCPSSGLNFGSQSHCYDATNSNHNMSLSSLKSCAANTNNHLGGSSMNYMSHLGPDINASCSLTNDTIKNINIDSCEQITDIKSNVTCQMNNMNINPCQMNSDSQSHLNNNNTLGIGNMLLSNTNQNNQESKDDCNRDIGGHVTPNTGLNSCSNNTQLNTTAKDCKNVNMCNKVSQNINMQSTNMFGGSNSAAGGHVCNQSGTQGNVPAATSTTEKKLDSNVLSLDWVAEIMKDYTPELLENGGKMVLLFSLIEESLKVSDKMLVFSQSLTTLNVIEDFLNRRQVPRPEMNENWCKNKSYFRLDGSTSAAEREKLINQFNSPDNNRVWLFLLSTRAGCLGINLIGANRVVIFDASWNPCHDCQAVCRVYRYGQQKHSYIYRLITDNTLEKKIYDRQINKQGMSDRVVDELNPENQFTRQQVDSLLHYVDQDLPEVKLDNFNSDGDSVLQTVLEKNGNWLTKEPFTHESLLLDQKSLRLTKKEKQLAKQGYVMEKKMNLNYSRQSYTMYYPKPGQSAQYYQGPGPWPNNMQAGERPVASVKPIISTPVPMSLPQVNFPLNQMLRSTVSGQQVKVVRPGVSVHQIVTTTDIMLPGSNNNSSYPDVIPAGQQIHVIKTPRGVYIRTNKGKIFAVRSKPPASSTTTNQTPPTSLSDLLLPPALPTTSTTTSSGNLSNIGASSSNLGSNNNAPGKNSLSFLESRPNNQIINSNNTEAALSSNYPDYLNYLQSLKPQFQSGYFPKALSNRNSNVGNNNFNSMLPQHMLPQSPSSQQLSHFPVDSQASDRNKSFPSSTHQLGSHSLSLPATSLQKQMSLQKDNDICIISDDEGKMDNESEGIVSAPTKLNVSSSSTDNCSNTDITNKSSSSFIHSPALDLPAMIDNMPLQTTTNTSNINISSQSPYNSDSYVRSSPKLTQVVEMGNSASNNSCTVDPQQIGSNDFSTHSLLPAFSSIPQSENHHQHQGHRQPQISPIPVSNSGLSSASNLNMSSSNFSPSLPNLQQQSLYNIPNYNYSNMLSPHMLTNKKPGQSPIENSGYNALPTFSPSIMNQAPINNNNNNNNNNNPDNLTPRSNTSEPSLSHSQTLSSLL